MATAETPNGNCTVAKSNDYSCHLRIEPIIRHIFFGKSLTKNPIFFSDLSDFVGFVRRCEMILRASCLDSIYSMCMEKKILQLHISYFRKKVAEFSAIRSGMWKKRGVEREHVWYVVNGKRVKDHLTDSAEGKKLLFYMDVCKSYKDILFKLESEWNEEYGGSCPTINIPNYGMSPRRQMFERLVERSNKKKFINPVIYNDQKYRSKLESDFARIMDDNGILYKYEPGVITYNGKRRCPDFVIYLPWIDLIILVELFGKCEDPEYLPTIRERMGDYIGSGWIPGFNMLAMYYSDKTPYDPKMVMEEIGLIEYREYILKYGGESQAL